MLQPAPTWFVTSVRKQHTSENVKTRLLDTIILFVCWRFQTWFSKSHARLWTAFVTSQVSETSSACLLGNYAFFSCYSLHLQLPEEQWSCLRQTISWPVCNIMQSCLDAAQQLLPLPHSLGKSLASLLTLRLKRSKACRLRQKVESYTGSASDSISLLARLLVRC